MIFMFLEPDRLYCVDSSLCSHLPVSSWCGPSKEIRWRECFPSFPCLLIRVAVWDHVNVVFLAFSVCLTVTSPPSFPPSGNWVLERSLDGVTFEPWQYYAITDTECLTRFNITPRTGPPSYTRDDEVICTSFYSKIPPLENGEVTTDTH